MDKNDIMMEVRRPSKMGESAAELSLYIYPQLARPIAGEDIYKVLSWIKNMQHPRRMEIISGCKVMAHTRLGEMTERQRQQLATELDAVAEYTAISKGKRHV